VIDALTRPQRSDEFQGLIQAFRPKPWIVGFTEGSELHRDAAETGTQHDPTAAESVEAGDGVGDNLRTATASGVTPVPMRSRDVA